MLLVPRPCKINVATVVIVVERFFQLIDVSATEWSNMTKSIPVHYKTHRSGLLKLETGFSLPKKKNSEKKKKKKCHWKLYIIHEIDEVQTPTKKLEKPNLSQILAYHRQSQNTIIVAGRNNREYCCHGIMVVLHNNRDHDANTSWLIIIIIMGGP